MAILLQQAPAKSRLLDSDPCHIVLLTSVMGSHQQTCCQGWLRYRNTQNLTLWVRTAGYHAVHTSLVYEARHSD